MYPEKAFQLYFAVRLHFISEYDVFESGTKFRGKAALLERKDFNLIHDVLRVVKTERELIEYCASNHLYGNPLFLYDPQWAETNYKHWITIKQSLTYTLEKDLSTIEAFLMTHNCTLRDYLRKQVISDLLSQRVEYETFMLLDRRIPIICNIEGFDALKYKVRMNKASKFVNKGTLDLRHISHIDSFLATIEKENHGNNSITTP